MRKLLILPFPFAIVLVIGLAFFLLDSRARPSSVLGIKKAAAASPNFTIPSTPKAPTAPSIFTLKKQPTVTPTPTVTPFPTATPTPTLILTPTKVPTPTKRPTLTPTKSPQVTTQPLSNSAGDYLLQKINDYRASQGLASVKTDSYTCGFAATRAEEISHSFNHDGFSSRINSHTLPYPSYHKVTENIAMTSDYKQVVTMWINSSGHAENMRQDTPNVCVVQFGNYYAYEGWRP